MDRTLSKKALVRIAEAIRKGDRLDVTDVEPFLNHEFPETSSFGRFMLKVAAGISLFFASVLVIFPEVGEKLIEILPGFFLLPERLAKALDYVWSLVGKPVGKQHLMYHLPNIIIYAFGVAGIRQLWRRINKNNWKDLVGAAQDKLEKAISEGTARFTFAPGFSLLFVGEGDQIAKSLVADDPTLGPTIASRKPPYTNLWGRFKASDGDEGFERVLDQFNSEDAGEYVLFPVVDEHLFLPGMHEYDLPPHRVEIAVRRIREYEKERGWDKKQILIVGDKEQKSRFVTASDGGRVDTPNDEVSLRTIAADYEKVTIADPTDITLRKIIDIADGRKILFRASDQGADKYGAEFYHRLSLLGYAPSKDNSLTVGYDISDLETEHQVVSQKHTEYLPVIISRDIFDLLSKSYLRDGTYIFVPRLVKRELQRLVAQDEG
ncbi:hypothetical protein FGK63_02005 [Ruegeria sediminis]|uniref:Uncharacterized protein n=1 Tax=Ruegeria sediminis TaxID=2583820 RepID=A0ABY2X449_9RHOB|nr:hypothetical protein [Ruegeria sediminis]TMV09868.1 hypothetical protein FGK63_02005 [Ruegeria sediminis]